MAAFYRILFNASYLNRADSEEVLKILSNTTYRNGIPAGVPENVLVAHKFGERYPTNVENNSQLHMLQLHDCGIIYYPKRPYILCIMTRGDNLETQQTVIAHISSFIYEKISRSN